MNTTVKSLQDLYVKLGGSLTDTYSAIASGIPVSNYVTIPDVISAINKIAENGGSSLPAVTSMDNGSVLTVVEGEWNKAQISNEIELVTFTQMAGTSGTCSHSFSQISNAVTAGKLVILKYIPSGDGDAEYHMLNKIIDATSSGVGVPSYVYFSGSIDYGDSKLNFTTVYLQYTEAMPGFGTLTAQKDTYTVTPDATT